MIRKLEQKDIKEVVGLWYNTSIQAHNFISPKYWEKNKEAMATVYLPNSESYLQIKGNKVVGFISMADNYLAALFVKINMQGMGIGTKLLNYIKKRRERIQLRVYRNNPNSVNYYKNQGFSILSESIDNDTKEIEFLMEWSK